MYKVLIALAMLGLVVGRAWAVAGDVWYEVVPVKGSRQQAFDAEIYVDAQGSNLGAYQFALSYDPNAGVAVDTGRGRYAGVSAGADGFVTVANTKAAGEVIVNGFNPSGRAGTDRMHVVTVHFTGNEADADSLHLYVETLADSVGQPID
jgi:hypothetical protein